MSEGDNSLWSAANAAGRHVKISGRLPEVLANALTGAGIICFGAKDLSLADNARCKNFQARPGRALAGTENSAGTMNP